MPYCQTHKHNVFVQACMCFYYIDPIKLKIFHPHLFFKYYQVVRNAIIGLGTDEDSLTRAIVTRAEIDMMKVRGEYFNMYQSSLDNAVIGDTSGDYKNFLMTLLGAKI